MIAAVRYVIEPWTPQGAPGVSQRRRVRVFYDLPPAEVRTRLLEAVRRGVAGVSDADVADVEAGQVREVVLERVFEPAALDAALAGTETAVGSPAVSGRPSARPRKRLLAVEGATDLLDVFRLLFDPGRYRVQWAGDLLTARAVVFGPSPPDLVLLDLVLPDGNGLDLCREIKATRPWLPVLALTARVQSGWREEAGAAGADLFMTKPFALEPLEAAVVRLLREADHRPGRPGAG